MENNRSIAKSRLQNALFHVYSAELAENTESAFASRRHYRKMSHILRMPLSAHGDPVFFRRRALVALFVAAAILLLGGFGVVAYEEIENVILSAKREIFEYYGEDRYRIHFHFTEPKSQIEETYALTYVPEGYELVHQENEELFVTYSYRKNKRETLKFSQNATISENVYDVLPIGEHRDFTHNGVDYYYTEDAVYNYLEWQNESYLFSIRTTIDFSEEELLKMIDGVKIVNNDAA